MFSHIHLAILAAAEELEKLKEEKNQEIGRMQEKMAQAAEDRGADEQMLRDKVTELNQLIMDHQKNAQRTIAEKAQEILELREKIEELEFSYDELAHAYEENDTKSAEMQAEIQSLKVSKF